MIINTTKLDFDVLNESMKIIVHDHARRFAFLEVGTRRRQLGISWRSDDIEPVCRYAGATSMVWIGVDQQVAAVDFQTGRVHLLLPLGSNLLDIEVHDTVTVVLTETEVVVFNIDGSIGALKPISDLPQRVMITNGEIAVELVSGDVVLVRTPGR